MGQRLTARRVHNICLDCSLGNHGPIQLDFAYSLTRCTQKNCISELYTYDELFPSLLSQKSCIWQGKSYLPPAGSKWSRLRSREPPHGPAHVRITRAVFPKSLVKEYLLRRSFQFPRLRQVAAAYAPLVATWEFSFFLDLFIQNFLSFQPCVQI